MDAFSNGMKNPIPLLGPATGAAYAIMAGISSAANIAKIASTQYQSTSGSATPPPTTTPTPTALPQTLAAPSTMGLGGMKITQEKEQFNWQKVYVVESDIRGVSGKVQVIEQRSVLGG
jgi:hypothetical protein